MISMSDVRQMTDEPKNHVLTNIGVWSPDGKWIVYDTRSDPAGSNFDGSTIEQVNVETGEVRVLYRSQRGAHCGVATCHPIDDRIIFILGPQDPTPDWQYSAFHRGGMIVSASSPDVSTQMDARDIVPPFTSGALRGGSHVHVFSTDGQWVSFTYEDHLLAQFADASAGNDVNQRNIGVAIAGHPVRVRSNHQRNHDGEFFSVLVTRTTAHPRPGSDEISRACEEGWVGTNGYLKADGKRQSRAIAFQGQVTTNEGETISEAFIVDLPDDLTQPGDGPLAGTETRAPFPPKGCVQRRLTFTASRKFPGLQGPRHWLRSSPDGSRIAMLMKDDAGIVQLWTVSPLGGPPRQLTRNPWPIASAFSWSPDCKSIAHAMDNSILVTNADTGISTRLTPRYDNATAPRPEACVFSPDGRQIAFVRHVSLGTKLFNQVFVVKLV